ncbi:MAG: hypothetical protein SFU99_16125 [Saprospiraceae bacterium]|nr:hypothetical protein [Saprospiraceae bacterium]
MKEDRKKKKSITIKKPPILFEQTQAIIQELKQNLEGDFLVYWTSDNSHIVEEDVIPIFKLLKERNHAERLYLFLKSNGGSGQGALRIINLLRQYYQEIVALIPLDCASAATMLALGADVIHMGPLAYLSAIDTSITHDLSPIDKDNDRVSVSQNELDRVIRLWEQSKQSNDSNPYDKLYQYIHPLVFGSVDRASSLSIKLTTEILSYHMDDLEAADKISHHLNSAYPSHGYPITFREAQRIGLKVQPLDNDVNNHLLRLNASYSEMAQRAYSDYDESNYHDNEILKILEIEGEQLYYQKDKDMHYRAEERRWVSTNDESSWRTIAMVDGKRVSGQFFIN